MNRKSECGVTRAAGRRTRLGGLTSRRLAESDSDSEALSPADSEPESESDRDRVCNYDHHHDDGIITGMMPLVAPTRIPATHRGAPEWPATVTVTARQVPWPGGRLGLLRRRGQCPPLGTVLTFTVTVTVIKNLKSSESLMLVTDSCGVWHPGPGTV